MHRSLLLALVLILFAATTVAAERIDLNSSDKDVSVVVEESNDNRTVVRFEIGAFYKDAIDVDGRTYYSISCGTESNLMNAGAPSLPRLCRSIIIPDNAKMQLNVLESEYVEIENIPVISSKGNLLRTVNPEDVPYEFGPVYSGKDFYPSELAGIRDPFVLRDFRGTVIELNAFSYNPDSEVLRIYTSVTVEVVTAGPGEVNVLDRKNSEIHLVPDFDIIYSRQFINYSSADKRYTVVDEIGDLLIITYDAFASQMEPFVEWKMQKGMKTTMVNVSSIGNTSTNIKNFIQSFFDSTQLAHVLLVGDAAQVATMSASGGASDPSYAKVAGGDDYPDMFVGRFSAETTSQVETQVQRMVTYEKNPVPGDWFHMATGVASNQGPGHNGGEYDDEHMDLIRDSLLSYTYTWVDQIYDPSGTAAQVSAALNEGRSFVNYTGHGSTTSWSSTGFSNTNVNALVNDNKLPFIVSVACVNGNFQNYTCFGEAWLRATNSGAPTGAIGAYMSSINQSWDPPMDAQDEVTHLLINEVVSTYGGLCFNGSCRMIEINGSGGVSMYNTWHIFGDPSLQVRTDTPASMNVVHSGAVFFHMTEYEVDVVGVEGALCGLYHDGVLYGSAYTDAFGHAVIPIGQMMPIGEQLTLTVTGYNKETVQEPVQVTSDLAIVVTNPLTDTKDSLNPYDATCTIYSEDALVADSLLLYYEVNSTWYTDTLQPIAREGDYFGVIPAQSPGTVVNYYFYAANVAGNADTTDVFTFKVIDYGVILEPEYAQQTAPAGDTLWYDMTVTNDGVLSDSYSLSKQSANWPTTFWDASGTTQITTTASLLANEQYDFKTRVVVPSSWEGQYDSIAVVATSVGDNSVKDIVNIKSISAGQPWPIPFTENFLTTDLDTYKWETGAGTAINELGINEPSAPYSIDFNGSPYGGDTLISEAINLRYESNVIVKYYYERKGGGDSPETGDDLEVDYLDEYGVWHNLTSHPGDGPDMTEYEVSELSLPSEAYHAGFRVRFSNSGSSGSYDDWFVDNIYIGHPPAYQVSVSPSFQEQYGPAGDSAIYAIQVHNEGLYEDQYAMSDSLGAWNMSFWYEDGTQVGPLTDPVPAGDSLKLYVKVAIPIIAPLNTADTSFVKAWSDGSGGTLAGEAIIISISAGAAASVPWYEPFDTSYVDMSHWMVNVGAEVVSNTYAPPSPPYAVSLDGGCDTLVSQLIDLSGQDGALFMYHYQRTGPGETPDVGDDLVFEYKNSSGVWTEISRQLGSAADMTQYEFVEVPLAGDALHNSFQVRIHSFGSGEGYDDWYVDDLRIDFAPSIDVTPTSMNFALDQGDSAQSQITISNGGPGQLTYSIQTVPVFSKETAFGRLLAEGAVEPARVHLPEGAYEDYEDVKGVDDNRVGKDVRFNAGGPDAYGYIWVDSDEPGGPSFDWIDIQATGTEVTDLGDDSFSGPYSLGFTFEYYGIEYTEFYIASNGFIGFGPTDGYLSRTNTVFPSAGVPNNMLAWCWDDLNPVDGTNPGAHVYYHSDGNRVVIQFVDYPEYSAGAGDVINAEVIISANGHVKYQYLSIAAGFDVLNCTVGIENETGIDGLTTVFGGAYLKDSLAVEYMAPAQWLTIDPIEGDINSGGSDLVWAFVTTTDLDEGSYEAVIKINSNDPDAEDNPWAIPVTLNVGQVANYPPVLSEIGPQTMTEGETMSLLLTASDPNGTIPQFSALNMPDNSVMTDSMNGTASFEFWPDLAQAGVYEVTFIASDGELADSEEVTITVEDSYMVGDADGTGNIDIDDAVFIIAYVFSGGPSPEPLLAGDCDCSLTVDIDDAVYIINYIFGDWPAPGTACGKDGDIPVSSKVDVVISNGK